MLLVGAVHARPDDVIMACWPRLHHRTGVSRLGSDVKMGWDARASDDGACDEDASTARTLDTEATYSDVM